MGERKRAWNDYRNAITTKTRKGSAGAKTALLDLMVQKMSAEATDKLQKFHPLRTREFVPFNFEELREPNIKRACKKHFKKAEGSCDVIAEDRHVVEWTNLEEANFTGFDFCVSCLRLMLNFLVHQSSQASFSSTNEPPPVSIAPSVSIATLLKAGTRVTAFK